MATTGSLGVETNVSHLGGGRWIGRGPLPTITAELGVDRRFLIALRLKLLLGQACRVGPRIVAGFLGFR